MSILDGMVEDIIEVFMDDFSAVGDSFDDCLANLTNVLRRFEEYNLVLNWEECHFIIKEGIVLDHRISKKRIEVNKENIKVIEKLSSISMKSIHSFLVHTVYIDESSWTFLKL